VLPLSLDPSRLRIALIGNGASALRRLAWLEQSGATALAIYAAAPSPALAAFAGERLIRHWPDMAALRGRQLIFIADPPAAERRALAQAARRAGAILHVEDEPELCDVHAPAVLHRGELTFAISTNGAAPGLAAEMKQFLAGIFGPEWSGRLDEIKTLRRGWRRAGATHRTIRRRTAARIAQKGWFRAISLEAADNERSGRAEFDHGDGGGQTCP